jgi:hypothetical protein
MYTKFSKKFGLNRVQKSSKYFHLARTQDRTSGPVQLIHLNLGPNFGPVLKSSGPNFGSEPDCGIPTTVALVHLGKDIEKKME